MGEGRGVCFRLVQLAEEQDKIITLQRCRLLPSTGTSGFWNFTTRQHCCCYNILWNTDIHSYCNVPFLCLDRSRKKMLEWCSHHHCHHTQSRIKISKSRESDSWSLLHGSRLLLITALMGCGFLQSEWKGNSWYSAAVVALKYTSFVSENTRASILDANQGRQAKSKKQRQDDVSFWRHCENYVIHVLHTDLCEQWKHQTCVKVKPAKKPSNSIFGPQGFSGFLYCRQIKHLRVLFYKQMSW